MKAKPPTFWDRDRRHTERWQEFLQDAAEADRRADAGGPVYAASDVHSFLDAIARGSRPRRQEPCSLPKNHTPPS